jgi:heme A synthase
MRKNKGSALGWTIGIIAALFLIWVVWIIWRPSETITQNDETAVRNTVTMFGGELRMVPLSSSKEAVGEAMEYNYASFVAPELISKWEKDPLHAPGRLTSSPYPDHIDITSVNKNSDGTYIVKGNVIDLSSSNISSSTNSGSYPVTIKLENRNGLWLITNLTGYPK